MALQPRQPGPRQRNFIVAMLRSRYYYSASLTVTCLLLTGIALTLAMRPGALLLTFARTQPITITGATPASTVALSNLLHVYILGDVRVPAA